MKRKRCRFPLAPCSGKVWVARARQVSGEELQLSEFLYGFVSLCLYCIRVMKMNSRYLLGVLCLIGVACMPVKASALRIAYVDARVLIDEAPQGKYEIRILEQEFGERNRDLKARIELFNAKEAELQKNAVLLSSEELEERTVELRDLQITLQRDQKIYNEDYARSRNRGLARLEKLISEVIVEIARREEIDLVVQQAVYASREIDLTGKILEQLNKDFAE